MNLKFSSRIGLLFFTILIAAISGPAAGVEKVNNATSDTATATKTTIVNGRASITLKGEEAEVLVTVGKEFQNETTHEKVDAKWIKYPLATPSDGTFKLMSGETATFEVSGEFAKPGVYEIFIEAAGKLGTSRYPVRITRTMTAVTDGLLLEPKPLHADLSFLNFLTPKPYPIQLTAHNASNEPVEIGQPIVGQLLFGPTDAKVQSATETEPMVSDDRCPRPLPANQSCVFAVQLPSGVAPGSYSINVIVPGNGGGQSVRTLSVDVRASAWLAGIVIALGVLLGAAVTDWRTARPIAVHRIETARLRDAAQTLANTTKQAAVRRRATRLVSELTALDTEILAGVDTTAKVGDYKAWIELLTRADGMLIAVTQPTEPRNNATETFGLLAQRLCITLDAIEWNRDAVAAALETLCAELADFDLLYQAARRYDLIAAKLAPAASYLGTDAPAEWNSALDLRNGAFVPIEPGGDGKHTATRATALNGATAVLEKKPAAFASAVLEKLDREITRALQAPPTDDLKAELAKLQRDVRALKSANPPVEGTLDDVLKLSERFVVLLGLESADGAINVPIILAAESGLIVKWPNGALQPAAGAPLTTLLHSLRAWDWITNVIALAGIASAGVLVLWMTNNTWGSVQDIVLALLAGAGTRLSIGKIGQQ
ncbi:hypothetical protein [Pararhizobium gei]|uniref:hypothetical protein n=1 Tax=Pararhizobium gei TaxID=1395951 RepID=UPI0023DB4B20|nr:hypothetical protein [Rhizobium gei]